MMGGGHEMKEQSSCRADAAGSPFACEQDFMSMCPGVIWLLLDVACQGTAVGPHVPRDNLGIAEATSAVRVLLGDKVYSVDVLLAGVCWPYLAQSSPALPKGCISS